MARLWNFCVGVAPNGPRGYGAVNYSAEGGRLCAQSMKNRSKMEKSTIFFPPPKFQFLKIKTILKNLIGKVKKQACFCLKKYPDFMTQALSLLLQTADLQNFEVPKTEPLETPRSKVAIPLGKQLKIKDFSTFIYSRPQNSLQLDTPLSPQRLLVGKSSKDMPLEKKQFRLNKFSKDKVCLGKTSFYGVKRSQARFVGHPLFFQRQDFGTFV